MQRHITSEEIAAAARRLALTPRGHAALQRLLDLLDTDDLPLDLLDQRAFLALLGGAWSGRGDEVRAAIRTATVRADTSA